MRSPLLALVLLTSASFLSAQEDKATLDAIAKINSTGASLAPLSAEPKSLLRFTALNVAKEFSDAGLAALVPLAGKIQAVDVARSKVTDAGLASLSGMKQLKELHLENTAITDAGLAHLKSLSELEYMNLYGTKVTDAGVKQLAALPKLKSIYLWQTAVTQAGADALRKALPTAQINIGWTKEDDAKPLAVVAAAPAAKEALPLPVGAKPADAAAASTSPAGAKLDEALAAKTLLFKDVIMPIVQEKCVACHGETKSKGKLKMHTFADIMKGGGEGGNVVAGKPADSLMVKRIALPEDDDEHMPPSDEKQLTKDEVKLVNWWIEQGASETLTVAAAKRSPELDVVLAALLKASAGKPAAAAPAPKKAEKPKLPPLTEAEKKAVADVTKKIAETGATLMPLAMDTEQLRLSVVNAAGKFGDKELALLTPVAKHVLWVDLARSQVTDESAATLAKFTALERLHLENTKITDTTLAQLSGLKSIEYLNIYGTKVTDAGLGKLVSCAALRKAFVWQTAITRDAAKALETKIPGLSVNVGLTEAEIAKLTAPPPAPPAPAAKPATPPATKPDPKAADNTKPAAKGKGKAKAKAAAVKAAATGNPADAKAKPVEKK